MISAKRQSTATTRRKRKPDSRAVKIHRSYTVEEAARVTGCAKGTVRRWIASGKLPVLADQRPHLILGGDLSTFLANRRSSHKLRPHECFCLKCKAPRPPALGMAEYVPLSAVTGNLRGLCAHCLTVMCKAVSRSALEGLSAVLTVTVLQGPKHLADTANPSSDDHLDQEPTTDA